MTPEDLDAIRARDATDANITSREAIDAWFVQLRIDVRALLAEVDRLIALYDSTMNELPGWERGVRDAERARIAAAVRGLAKGPNPSRSRLLDPDAVLAVIEGGEKPDRSRPCAADPRCCRWLGHEGDHLYPDMGTT